MARKKRKKEKAGLASHTREGAPLDLGPDEGSESVRSNQPLAAHAEIEENSGLPPEQKFDSFPPSEGTKEPEGFFARLSRWFQGESEPAYSPPPPIPPPEPRAAQVSDPVRRQSEPEPPPSPAVRREHSDPPSSRRSVSDPAGTAPASKVDHVLAVLTLERVLPELDAARKQLEEMRLSSDRRIQQLERERDELRGEIGRGRAAEPRASEAAELRHRLQEELDEARKSAEARIQQLEAELDQSRAEAGRAIAAQDDLNLRIRQLEATLEAKQSEESAEQMSTLETPLRTLEEELSAVRAHAEQERETATVRIAQLEAERSEMAANLASKEKKLLDSLAQIEEVHEQARRLEEEMERLRNVESERDQLSTQLTAKAQELLSASQQAERVPELEAEITEWKTRAAQAAGASVPEPEAAPVSSSKNAADLSNLYQQTMARLTVIQASAELLAMNSRLDSSSRETAQEIRNASQLLSDIIKNFTLPPDRRKAE